MLVGLVLSQGILRCETEEELERYAADAYRRYRRRYKLPLFGYKDKTALTDENETVGLVDRLRDFRDYITSVWRKIRGHRQYKDDVARENVKVPCIEFIGVWDTVAAYGLPIEELTRGIDEWVWPLSMPNYQLHERVRCARHALSLDDERDSFHPLLWDEVAEEKLIQDKTKKVKPGRLQQVWFAGVHSNVGGGYADDSLSLVPLQWMMREAGDAGLRFDLSVKQETGEARRRSPIPSAGQTGSPCSAQRLRQALRLTPRDRGLLSLPTAQDRRPARKARPDHIVDAGPEPQGRRLPDARSNP